METLTTVMARSNARRARRMAVWTSNEKLRRELLEIAAEYDNEASGALSRFPPANDNQAAANISAEADW